MNKWMWRRLNSLGYGVQSPNDFYFVQHVLREQLPYYAYTALEEMVGQCHPGLPCYSMKLNRLLFRLTNYVHPEVIVEVGGGFSIMAMAMACPTARCVAITPNHMSGEALQQLAASYSHVEVKEGDEMEFFSQLLSETAHIGMLHVAHTSHYREVVEAISSHASRRTLVVIEGIKDSQEKHDWWHQLQESQLAGITYDLDTVGLLFLDHSRHKETYWINLRD